MTPHPHIENNEPSQVSNATALATRKALRYELDPSSTDSVASFKKKYPDLADIAGQAAACQSWPESGEAAIAEAAEKIAIALKNRQARGKPLNTVTIKVILRGVFARWHATLNSNPESAHDHE